MSPAALDNPFPGLRPFEPEESHLFFGREGQSDELLARLRRKRLLAVVGTSGSGKSSLVRAGLLPALYGGLMAESTVAAWSVACFRPGSDPIGNLARALAGVAGLASLSGDLGIETTLRRSGLGLLEAARLARMPAGQSLLVVVDQFEELFRFKASVEASRSEDAAAFVKLLLEATAQAAVPVYAVLTMRSDFLGDCAQFRDLPERLNDAQYLIPRMTRDQRREAITGPVLVGGGRIAPRLVNRLLNDLGDNPDQLPILQHALMRTWDLWAPEAAVGGEIDLEHYEAIGGMAAALSHHADEAFEELAPRQREIAESLFKGLTEKGADNREIRRPTRLAELAAASSATAEEITVVVEVFRREGRSFLMPRAGVTLEPDTVVDISHESLIRGWQRLRVWAEEEAQSAQMYRRVADAVVRHVVGKAALWRDADLTQALRWREKNRPNAAWARRYHADFAPAMAFLDSSRRARRQRLTVATAVTVVVAIGIITLASVVVRSHKVEELLAESRWAMASRAATSGGLFKAAHFFALNARFAEAEFQRWSALNTQLHLRALLAEVIPQAVEEAEGRVNQVSSSRDGKRFVAWTSRGGVRLWDSNARPVGSLLQPGLLGATFSDDGHLLLTWGANGIARLWQSRDGAPASAAMLHGDRPVRGGVFRPGLAQVLTWSDAPTSARPSDGAYAGLPPSTAHLWSTEDGSALPWSLPALDRALAIGGAAFSPDGKYLAIWSGQITYLWDLTASLSTPHLLKQAADVTGVAFRHDGRVLLTWGGGPSARLWSTADGAPAAPPLSHERELLGASFSEDGKHIVTWGLDAKARLWTADGLPIFSMAHLDTVRGAAFSQDQRSLLTWSADGAVRLWDVEDGTVEAEMLHGDSLVSATLAARGQIITWGGENSARVWSLKVPEPLESGLAGPKQVPLAEGKVASPDGASILRWGLNQDATLVPTQGPPSRTVSLAGSRASSISGGVFSHDSKLVLTWGFDGVTRLWKVADGKPAIPPIRQDDWVTGAAFSPDDALILTWDKDCARLWNTFDGSAAAAPMRSEGPLWDAAFSPRGDSIVTRAEGGPTRRWEIGADYDFPHDQWPLLVEVATGGRLEEKSGVARALSPLEWAKKKRQYLAVAAEHLKHCEFKSANLYSHRQRALWSPGAASQSPPAPRVVSLR